MTTAPRGVPLSRFTPAEGGVLRRRWVASAADGRTVPVVRHPYRRQLAFALHELDFRDLLSARIVGHACRLLRTPAFRPDDGRRLEALLHLLAILEWRRYDWEIANDLLARPGVRRRIARLTGVRGGAMRRGLVVLRNSDGSGSPRVRLGADAAAMTCGEKELLGLLTLWAGEGFDPSQPVTVVESRYAPQSAWTHQALGWVELGEEWSDDRIEILERLVADGMTSADAVEVALCV